MSNITFEYDMAQAHYIHDELVKLGINKLSRMTTRVPKTETDLIWDYLVYLHKL